MRHKRDVSYRDSSKRNPYRSVIKEPFPTDIGAENAFGSTQVTRATRISKWSKLTTTRTDPLTICLRCEFFLEAQNYQKWRRSPIRCGEGWSWKQNTGNLDLYCLNATMTNHVFELGLKLGFQHFRECLKTSTPNKSVAKRIRKAIEAKSGAGKRDLLWELAVCTLLLLVISTAKYYYISKVISHLQRSRYRSFTSLMKIALTTQREVIQLNHVHLMPRRFSLKVEKHAICSYCC